jgi:hypothetical protein
MNEGGLIEMNALSECMSDANSDSVGFNPLAQFSRMLTASENDLHAGGGGFGGRGWSG